MSFNPKTIICFTLYLLCFLLMSFIYLFCYRGSLLTRTLNDIVKKEDFVLDSEYLTTLLVVVPTLVFSIHLGLSFICIPKYQLFLSVVIYIIVHHKFPFLSAMLCIVGIKCTRGSVTWLFLDPLGLCISCHRSFE